MFNISGINPASGSHCTDTCRVPFFNTSAPPADSTCRNCVLPQPPDQNCDNKPTTFSMAGERCCCHTNWWRDKAGRHRFYTLFCICTAARQNEPCKEFMVSLESSKMPMSKQLLQSSAAGAGIMFPLFQLPGLGTWDLASASPSLMAVSQPRAQLRLGTLAAMLTLGKVSCPTRSCRCLMVLKAKVLMAKGSHRIMDKSLRRCENQTFVIHNQQPHFTGPNPAMCTWWTFSCLVKKEHSWWFWCERAQKTIAESLLHWDEAQNLPQPVEDLLGDSPQAVELWWPQLFELAGFDHLQSAEDRKVSEAFEKQRVKVNSQIV